MHPDFLNVLEVDDYGNLGRAAGVGFLSALGDLRHRQRRYPGLTRLWGAEDHVAYAAVQQGLEVTANQNVWGGKVVGVDQGQVDARP